MPRTQQVATRRRAKAERDAGQIPRAELFARNQCMLALSALEPEVALRVITRIGQSIREWLAVHERGG
jgi:hypothetical protein